MIKISIYYVVLADIKIVKMDSNTNKVNLLPINVYHFGNDFWIISRHIDTIGFI